MTPQSFAGEAKYKAIVEAIPSLIFLCDQYGVFLDYHLPEGEKLYTSPDYFLGKNVRDVFPAELVKHFENAFQTFLLTGNKQTVEYDLELNGIIHNYEAVITLCEKDKLLTVATDITERKHAEKELKESLAWKDSIFEGSRDAIFISNNDSKFIMVNQAACDLTRYSRNELLTMKIPDLHESMDLKAYIHFHDKIMNGEEQLTESKILKKNGEKVDTEFNNKRILIDNNYYMHTTARDITERKLAEEEIKIQNEKLLKLNAEKDKFLSIIAHDLKSPFQGFLNMTELMGESSDEFSAAEWVQNSKLLNKAAHNVYILLDNLLEWSKVKRGLIEYTPKELDLFKIVSESIDSISDRALQKGIAIITEIDNANLVFADERMISSVLRNLTANAVKFTRHGGKVTIKSARLGNGKIEIAVSDNGIGISEEKIAKLFKIEEKVGSLGTEGELSTGLGLLLCKEFIDIHDGIIWVESKENIGSTFSFCLPECV